MGRSEPRTGTARAGWLEIMRGPRESFVVPIQADPRATHQKTSDCYNSLTFRNAGLIRIGSLVSIATVLKAALGGGEDPGADELLPMMILTLVRVKPEKMYSVLSYVNNYTSDLKMDSESGYLITQLMSAVQFLSELDASRITIATDDFEKKMLKCHLEYLLQGRVAIKEISTTS